MNVGFFCLGFERFSVFNGLLNLITWSCATVRDPPLRQLLVDMLQCNKLLQEMMQGVNLCS